MKGFTAENIFDTRRFSVVGRDLETPLLTYMSIEDEIQKRIAEGRLHRLTSLICGEETPRTMYVTTEVRDAVSAPFSEDREGERHAAFRQILDAFSEGDFFSVAERPHSKPSDAMLARVDPVGEGIWDIRCTAVPPGIRCLGAFVVKDVFVALTWDYRENLDEPGAWGDVVGSCKSVWRELFGTQPPLKGALDECLTNYHAV